MPSPQASTSSTLPKGIPLYEIIDCIVNKKLSQTDTAILLGCDKSNISKRLKESGYQANYLTTYKNQRADILASYQQIILNSITNEDLQKAGLSQKMMAYGVLYDKERLERGQSTENIAYADMAKAQAQVQEKLHAFESKYSITQETSVSSRT